MSSQWNHERVRMSRRSFLASGTIAAASIVAGGPFKSVMAQDPRGAAITAAVQTNAGRVRGLVRYGVNQFWGIPYGAATEGANRFMPPVRPASWIGVRE